MLDNRPKTTARKKPSTFICDCALRIFHPPCRNRLQNLEAGENKFRRKESVFANEGASELIKKAGAGDRMSGFFSQKTARKKLKFAGILT